MSLEGHNWLALRVTACGGLCEFPTTQEVASKPFHTIFQHGHPGSYTHTHTHPRTHALGVECWTQTQVSETYLGSQKATFPALNLLGPVVVRAEVVQRQAYSQPSSLATICMGLKPKPSRTHAVAMSCLDAAIAIWWRLAWCTLVQPCHSMTQVIKVTVVSTMRSSTQDSEAALDNRQSFLLGLFLEHVRGTWPECTSRVHHNSPQTLDC